MGFFGGMFRKAPVETGPKIVGRSDFGGEFSIGPNEAMVLDDAIIANAGAGDGLLNLSLKVGDRNGKLSIPFNKSSAAHHWYEFSIAALSLDNAQVARLKVARLCRDAKPITYNSDFWLKQGEAAAFEHGLVLRNKSVSKSRMGEFTNVGIELSHQGQKKDVTLVAFAKGKEKFVFADNRKSATFGPFEVKLNSATENEAVFNVSRATGLLAL